MTDNDPRKVGDGGTDANLDDDVMRELPCAISIMNCLAMDASQRPADRKRALTIAENCEKLLASLRAAQRKRLRAELAPPKKEEAPA